VWHLIEIAKPLSGRDVEVIGFVFGLIIKPAGTASP